jgi:GDPmannose 4,6-dehydratase
MPGQPFRRVCGISFADAPPYKPDGFKGQIKVKKKTALVTGVTGQDGAYLARLLVDKGYRVYGGCRWVSVDNLWRLREVGVLEQVELVDFDLQEIGNVARAIKKTRPDEIYNLAAQSFVGVSFELPVTTSQIDGMGCLHILEAIRDYAPEARYYQASTSEMFGMVREIPQTELTPFHPRSPYGVAKTFAHFMTQNYRESYGMHASSGILFNHESPLRGQEFVTRKITLSLARIQAGEQEVLELGNLDAKRDWGFAGDYVRAMWSMLQQEVADDYVIATGHTYTVRYFCECAARGLGIELRWEGEGVDETGIDSKTGKTLIRVSPKFFRPAEVDLLVGRPDKAREKLAWTPQVKLEALVEMMVRADRERVASGVSMQ